MIAEHTLTDAVEKNDWISYHKRFLNKNVWKKNCKSRPVTEVDSYTVKNVIKEDRENSWTIKENCWNYLVMVTH